MNIRYKNMLDLYVVFWQNFYCLFFLQNLLMNSILHHHKINKIFIITLIIINYFSTTCFAVTIETLTNPNITTLDNDLKRLNNLTIANSLHYHYEQIHIGEKSYRLGVFEKQPIGNIRYLVIHDSENASFDSGLQSLHLHGGRMVVLENAEKRGLFDFNRQQESKIDPNRIFFLDNQQAVDEQGLYLFSQYILEKLALKPESILVSLHNNNPYSRFGLQYIEDLGDISVICQQDNDPKNLFWFINTFSNNFENQALWQKLCQYDFNVVVENVGKISDKSLSNFSYFNNIDYVNIEIKMAEKGNIVSEQEAKFLQQNYINALIHNLMNISK